jgi:glycosyltransferase involved in cell wall biosynthesis
MRISFVLPEFQTRPSGGFKVVYEYARRLCARGHEVTVVHPRRALAEPRVAGLARGAWFRLRVRPPVEPLEIPWFPLPDEVRRRWVARIDERSVPDGDAVVATAWVTAGPVAALASSKGAKLYLIQHHEVWDGPADQVDATWRLPMHKVVIARWLMDLGVGMGEAGRLSYVPNGLDLDHMRVLRDPARRAPESVAMLWHPAPWKGAAEGVRVLEATRERVPGLRARLFGATPRPTGLPAWIGYDENPDPERLVALYNEAATFLHTSHSEGWGLPASEAMACGSALVAAANGGVLDYAEDERTALLAPVGDVTGLTERLVRLCCDPARRIELARAGREAISAYTWERALDGFEGALAQATRAARAAAA